MSSRRVAVASSDDDAGAKLDHSSASDRNHDDTGDDDDDDTARIESSPTSSCQATGSAAKYVVEQRSIAQLRALAASTGQDTRAELPGATDSSSHAQQPPPLDLNQLQQRRRSTIRRMSTKSRRIDETPDSLRLESTRRRASSVIKEPSRASVVYSPRALADVLVRQRTQPRRTDWAKFCSVM